MTSLLQNRQLLISIFFGLAIISIPFLSSPDLSWDFSIFKVEPFKKSLLSYLLLLVFFYLNYYFIVPKFYISKRWGLLLISLLISYAIIYFVPDLLMDLKPDLPIPNNPGNMPPRQGGPEVKNPLFNIFPRESRLFPFVLIFLLSLYLRLDNHLKDLKNEQLQTELSYLKAQINPHFLFNTLNTIYALALKKANTTPMAVLKLSNIMRYVVTENDQARVSIQNEIDYINDYIDLQKLRLSDDVVINFKQEGITDHHSIAPMLLINFVENAFKYGICQDEKSEIDILMSIEDNTLFFIVKNTNYNTQIVDINSTKEGIKNTQRRLAYIYPNKHDLKIIETSQYFKVKLEIELQ
ncbi:sensor histidine kinase [Mangrovimonas sp. ST2L15]|uniref:sensor histidine kinase n=1 Tax=Mangrovimonas sp. ST2L15 TaxID=1645916 RepID=UPI0006B50537|nr:sensor histidine kinase [Mangrovimonas sp. ST2L15]